MLSAYVYPLPQLYWLWMLGTEPCPYFCPYALYRLVVWKPNSAVTAMETFSGSSSLWDSTKFPLKPLTLDFPPHFTSRAGQMSVLSISQTSHKHFFDGAVLKSGFFLFVHLLFSHSWLQCFTPSAASFPRHLLLPPMSELFLCSSLHWPQPLALINRRDTDMTSVSKLKKS